MTTVNTEPCDECPWRYDATAPRPASYFEQRQESCDVGFGRMFMCHQSTNRRLRRLLALAGFPKQSTRAIGDGHKAHRSDDVAHTRSALSALCGNGGSTWRHDSAETHACKEVVCPSPEYAISSPFIATWILRFRSALPKQVHHAPRACASCCDNLVLVFFFEALAIAQQLLTKPQPSRIDALVKTMRDQCRHFENPGFTRKDLLSDSSTLRISHHRANCAAFTRRGLRCVVGTMWLHRRKCVQNHLERRS